MPEYYLAQEGIQRAYRGSLTDILQYGHDVEVRGFKTKEILDYTTIVTEPWHHTIVVPGRRWNPWLAMSEALWILAGRNDLATLEPYNKRIREFSDDGETLYGAYGRRIEKQIPELIARLEKDPNDRRAVLAIWQLEDLWMDTKDPPCNDLLMFKLRDHKLHMTVINRSNDLHWGLYGVNIPTFGILLDWLAARLDVEMGTQTHLSNSLHIYTDGPGMKPNYDITKNMMAKIYEPLPEMPRHERAFTEPVSLDTLVKGCNLALSPNQRYDGPISFLQFADDFLDSYRALSGQGLPLEPLRNQDKYMDWIKAGEIWRGEK